MKEFEVPAATRARFDSDGIGWPIALPLAEGTGKIRIVVRDIKTRNVGSLTVPLK